MPISQELIDIIIGLACKGNLATSLTCTLVCKAFVRTMQKEMFYKLFIHDYASGHPSSRQIWHSLSHALKFFHDSPHTSRFPRVLFYRANPNVSVTRLRRLLSNLTRVHTLIVDGSDTDIFALATLSPFLRNLYFRDSYIMHKGMSRLLTSSQNVKALSIIGDWVTSPRRGSSIVLKLPEEPVMVQGIRVLALDLLNVPSYQLALLRAWVTPLVALERLILKVTAEDDTIGAVQALILTNARSLLKLRVAVMIRADCVLLQRLWISVYIRRFACLVMVEEVTETFHALDLVLHRIGSKVEACAIKIHLVFDTHFVWEGKWYKDEKQYGDWIGFPGYTHKVSLMMFGCPIITTIQDNHGDLYACSNSDTIPPIPSSTPPFEEPALRWPADPEIYIARHWASNTMPYQGFLPVCSFPVQPSGRGLWSLSAKVIESWRNLEALLERLRQILESDVGNRNLDYLQFPLPWKYGYHHAKSSQKAMVYSAIHSRDAFILMAAEISYLLALALENDGYRRFQNWSAVLTREVGGKWVDMIRDSWLVQYDVGYQEGKESACRRVGIFIDPRNCNFGYFLRAYYAFKIPVWIHWGPWKDPYRAGQPEQLQDYYFHLPPSRTVDRITAPPALPATIFELDKGKWRQRLPGERFTLRWIQKDNAQLPKKISVQEDPQPNDDAAIPQSKAQNSQLEPRVADSRSNVATHQCLGETWQEFFRRRDEAVAQKKEHESVRERQSRKARELDAAKQHCPARSANIFVWDAVEGKDYLVRQHVPHRDVPDIWDDYAPSQRRYSSFWKEWDLNYAFDPDAEQSAEQLFEEDEDWDDGPSTSNQCRTCSASEVPESGK
ncbi:uncharacterized protein EV420DRAFT_1472664 [Desarmillaria tabescens]|uniref:Uncharacterized protein n=1 Tax=Armillaria tabescens TaxID=1929756 RepID=A0AA39NPV7_ARMTA|nr:uncharacterized protein EV420DRAFT_1472664 [Desarmillaria tabescens]KAK0469429.1 hypothetical protein EV420DRAFT_1472664 [Desarmillaria tabescens]